MQDPSDARGKYSPTPNQIFSRLSDVVSSKKSSICGNSDDGYQTPTSNVSNRHDSERHFGSSNMKEADNNIHFDQEALELLSRTRAQKEEIIQLHEQIADACLKELQILNEKHATERKFYDLRMALDEKQHDAITSSLKELNHRKGDLEENIKLAQELKAVENEKYIFTSSMLSLLADYGVRPNVMNALAISNSAKRLYDQFHWKIRTFHVSLSEMNSILENQAGSGSSNKDQQSSFNFKSLHESTIPDAFYSHNLQVNEQRLEQNSHLSRFIQANDQTDITDRQEERTSSVSEVEGFTPGIEGFQIIGDAIPGNTLQACGYPVRGTSLCMFQWIHHLQDGTRQYIEGATNPDYVVTADDVDKVIAVECIPMDSNGRQGDLVRLFANDQRKIACDADMQLEIEHYISAGQATFETLLLIDEVWQQARFILNRTSYQVKINRLDPVVIEEKYSPELYIKIPFGLSSQFVLTCSDKTSHPFSTYNDVRMRDTLVLTLRIYRSKALDDRRKGKTEILQ